MKTNMIDQQISTASQGGLTGASQAFASGNLCSSKTPRPRRLNVLILGGWSRAARAVLTRLEAQREKFGRVVLLDASEPVVKAIEFDDRKLEYRFAKRRPRFPDDIRYFRRLIAMHRIDVVINLMDFGSPQGLAAAGAGEIQEEPTTADPIAGCALARPEARRECRR